MKRIALDTNAYVAFKRGEPQAIEIIRQTEQLGISTVVLGELLAGFTCGDRATRNRRELSAFLDSPRVHLFDVGPVTADYYAHVFAGLKAKGRPIPSNDLWIAACALEHGFALYTHDRHFAEIENLPCGQILDDFLP